MKTYSLRMLVLLLSLVGLSTRAQQPVRPSTPVYSASMQTNIDNLVILPGDYRPETDTVYPVLYLLHGHGGNYRSWLAVEPELPRLATEKGIIIVCPDGKKSWYWDSPVDSTLRYETYVSRELVDYIDRHYATRPTPAGRAIAGFSMGGHGALWLAMRHPDVFGACGSMSGGVDIRPFPDNWNMSKSLGPYRENPERWDRHTVINLLPQVKPGVPAVIFDCGTDDFFYPVNEALHKKMLELGLPHDFISRPGAHTHAYWNNALAYQLVFFDKFFRK